GLRDQRVPDKAWRVPGTFIVGYTGARYLNGREGTIDWQPEQLKAGQRVGLLIASYSQDLVVYVDGLEAARVPGAELKAANLGEGPLFSIVDVYNATLAVKLLPGPSCPVEFCGH
ncbi:unnamed protein product, partial [Effrenium voratum]